MTENEKYLYDHFLISIKSGFESLEDIIEGAIEIIEDEGWQREISEGWVREILTKEYQKHEKASQFWSIETDTKKLNDVFNALCEKGILALHNVGYTTSEALYDIEDVRNALEDDDVYLMGFCYYHGQDLERVIEEEELVIGFGSVKGKNEKEAISIGNIVAATLKDAGFKVRWNNTAGGRITIVDFKWYNHFTSYEEVEKKWGHDRVFDLMK